MLCLSKRFLIVGILASLTFSCSNFTDALNDKGERVFLYSCPLFDSDIECKSHIGNFCKTGYEFMGRDYGAFGDTYLFKCK
jgi:hypothetical protein